MRDIYLCRLPILTRRLEIWGYEITAGRIGLREPLSTGGGNLPRTRPSQQTRPDIVSEEARLVLEALAEIGLPSLVGDTPALLRLSPTTVIAARELLAPLAPPDRLIPLLVVGPEPDPAALSAACDRLREAGFRVGLAGYRGQPELASLARTVHLVALSCREAMPDEFAQLVESLRATRAQILATEVEDYERFDRCRSMHIPLFSGSFLALPRPMRATRAPANRALLLLLARLQDPDVEFSELEALISLDVGLTYRLLRLVNSVWYGRRRIESVRQALLLLGTRLVSAWVTLLLMADIPDKPHELLTTAVIRARMAELIVAATGKGNREAAFLVGLLSVLDALLDQPMDELLAALPLAEELRVALLHRAGELGAILDLILAYERGNWERALSLGLRPSVVTSAYLDAIALAREIDQALAA
ncbi:MAG: HDOD domain-containing protein [Thermomicrobium sp.]|nr:HDOD domain-containing protein [Thermomicrobium sp.]